MPEHNLFSDFLVELGVPHTPGFSESSFRKMSFRSLFGLKKLLEKYGIDSEGLKIEDKSELFKLPVPFLAQTPDGFVIVTSTSPSTVGYVSSGQHLDCDAHDFLSAWTGMAFLAYPNPDSVEPDYVTHQIAEKGAVVKRVLLPLCAIALLVWLFVANGLWKSPSLWFVTIFDLIGLYFSFLLVQKSAGYSNSHADAVCGVLQKKGCDTILASAASKFYGLFGWAEVGLTYFSVSLLCLLFFPQYANWLALCNLCCLPFSFWSIWYQKYRARHWCTLCVGVQATLWALFFSYLAGGWISGLLPFKMPLFILGLTYLTVLLALNRLMPLLEKPEQNETYS